MTNEPTAELLPLPCPFCGETPDISIDKTFQLVEGGYKWGALGCACGCYGPDVRTSYQPIAQWKADAIKAWNTRAQTLSTDGSGHCQTAKVGAPLTLSTDGGVEASSVAGGGTVEDVIDLLKNYCENDLAANIVRQLIADGAAKDAALHSARPLLHDIRDGRPAGDDLLGALAEVDAALAPNPGKPLMEELERLRTTKPKCTGCKKDMTEESPGHFICWDCDGDIGQFKSELAALTAKLERANGWRDELQADLESVRHELATLRAELERVTDDRNRLRKEFDQFVIDTNYRSQYEAEIEQLKAQLTAANARVEELTKAFAYLQSQFERCDMGEKEAFWQLVFTYYHDEPNLLKAIDAALAEKEGK